jgi:hypothetical protein
MGHRHGTGTAAENAAIYTGRGEPGNAARMQGLPRFLGWADIAFWMLHLR